MANEGTCWVETTKQHWIDENGAEKSLECSLVSAGSEPEGTWWVEGTYYHYIDEEGDQRRKEGSLVGAGSEPEGTRWVEGIYIHYIDEEGDERRFQAFDDIIQDEQLGNTNLYASLRKGTGQRINDVPVCTVDSISLYLRKTGSPTGTLYARIVAVSDGAIIGTCGSLDVSTLTTSFVWYNFTTPVSVTSAQDIRVVVWYDGGSSSNRVECGITINNVLDSVRCAYLTSVGDWTDLASGSGDFTFKLYVTL